MYIDSFISLIDLYFIAKPYPLKKTNITTPYHPQKENTFSNANMTVEKLSAEKGILVELIWNSHSLTTG